MLLRTTRTIAATSRHTVANNQAVAGRRWTSIEHRGGKPKLIYRFGMKDIPVELYPLGFVVSMALVGGVVAAYRHFSLDGLRLKRAGGSPDINQPNAA